MCCRINPGQSPAPPGAGGSAAPAQAPAHHPGAATPKTGPGDPGNPKKRAPTSPGPRMGTMGAGLRLVQGLVRTPAGLGMGRAGRGQARDRQGTGRGQAGDRQGTGRALHKVFAACRRLLAQRHPVGAGGRAGARRPGELGAGASQRQAAKKNPAGFCPLHPSGSWVMRASHPTARGMAERPVTSRRVSGCQSSIYAWRAPRGTAASRPRSPRRDGSVLAALGVPEPAGTARGPAAIPGDICTPEIGGTPFSWGQGQSG